MFFHYLAINIYPTYINVRCIPFFFLISLNSCYFVILLSKCKSSLVSDWLGKKNVLSSCGLHSVTVCTHGTNHTRNRTRRLPVGTLEKGTGETQGDEGMKTAEEKGEREGRKDPNGDIYSRSRPSLVCSCVGDTPGCSEEFPEIIMHQGTKKSQKKGGRKEIANHDNMMKMRWL